MKHGKAIWIPQVISTVFLLIALSPENPYGYYIFLRWITCGIFAFLTFEAFRHEKGGWVWILGIVALIYNPLIPVYLGREIWTLVNLVTIGIGLTSISIFKDKR